MFFKDFFYRIYPETLKTAEEEENSSSDGDSDESDSDKSSSGGRKSQREQNKEKMEQYFAIRETKFANWAKVVCDDAADAQLAAETLLGKDGAAAYTSVSIAALSNRMPVADPGMTCGTKGSIE